MSIINRKFYLILGIIFLAELFSLFGYILSDFRQISFLLIILIFSIISLHKFEYGLLIILAELFIGSKGYLFYFNYDGTFISIRIALWIIIMSIWIAKLIIILLKEKKVKIEFLKFSYSKYYFVLFLFIIFGFINGILHKNELSNIFFDFNGWMYFLLVFPFYSIIKLKENIINILRLASASLIWLSAKTLFLLFIFSHNMIGAMNGLYGWVRQSGAGEITHMQGGFYRIFFQSHIFILAGFFIILFFIVKYFENFKNIKKEFIFLFILSSLFLSSILISFSRSFWIGLSLGLVIFSIFIFKLHGFKKLFFTFIILFAISIISLTILFSIIKFPYPSIDRNFNAINLFSERISRITGEAAVSSRWSLLPELYKEISDDPILGKGFGFTVTYKTSDPRIIETTANALYTTYAFEWGWLDIWLKLGFLGLISYLVLICKMFFDSIKIKDINQKYLVLGISTGLAVIVVVSFFSPYMNHPLGIGYLLMASCFLNKLK